MSATIIGVELAIPAPGEPAKLIAVEITPSLFGAQIDESEPAIAILGESAAVPVGGPGTSGAFDGVHNDLPGRSVAGAHPASAVTVLDTAGLFTGTQVEDVLAELGVARDIIIAVVSGLGAGGPSFPNSMLVMGY